MTSTVPPGRDSLHRYPGTSYLATISLSLRDKSHSPIEVAYNYFSVFWVKTPKSAIAGGLRRPYVGSRCSFAFPAPV